MVRKLSNYKKRTKYKQEMRRNCATAKSALESEVSRALTIRAVIGE